MLKSDERQVLFMDVVIRAESRVLKGAKPVSANVALSLIKQMFDEGEALKHNQKKTEIVYLADFQMGKSGEPAVLLVNRSDKKASDPAFSNPEKKSRRVVPKRPGEGQDNSAHIIWHKQPVEAGSNKYLFLMELSPGLTSSKVRSFLNHLLLEAARKDRKRFEVNHPDGSLDTRGKPRKAFCFPKVDLHGHICDDFKQELSCATIKGFELYTESEQKTVWDSHGYSEEKKKSVHIGITKGKLNPKNWPLIKEVFSKADKDEYEFARVIFDTEDNLGRSVKMYTDTVSMVKDFMYVKKANLTDFPEPLISSYEQTCKSIVNKMKKLS